MTHEEQECTHLSKLNSFGQTSFKIPFQTIFKKITRTVMTKENIDFDDQKGCFR